MIALTRTRWNLVIFATFLIGSIFILLTRVTPTSLTSQTERSSNAVADTPAPVANAPAPDFMLSSLDGSPVRLSDLKGQVVLVNIWATWCPPCRAEMPTIQTVYEQYHDKGFTVLAVDQDEAPRVVAAFMNENKLTFPALLDTGNRVGWAYQATALPSSFFIDKQGVIRTVYRGPMPRSVIAGTVEQLLNEGNK